jgi:hypothetical protein
MVTTAVRIETLISKRLIQRVEFAVMQRLLSVALFACSGVDNHGYAKTLPEVTGI